MSKTREKMFEIARRKSHGRDLVSLYRLNQAMIVDAKKDESSDVPFIRGHGSGTRSICQIINRRIKETLKWEIRLED